MYMFIVLVKLEFECLKIGIYMLSDWKDSA